MKAEQRKELETNALAENLAHTADYLKAHANLVRWLAGGTLAVIVVGVIAWYLLGGVSTTQSRLWTTFGGADTSAALEKLAKDNPGTLQARSAKFEAARLLFREGFGDFGTMERHADAVARIDKARSLYESLLTDSRGMPALEAEALMGIARIEETLSGSPKPDNATAMYGSLDRAAEFYKKVVSSQPGSFEAKKAAERIKAIEERKDELQAFYKDLNTRFTKPKN
jgi:hypothetical protein